MEKLIGRQSTAVGVIRRIISLAKRTPMRHVARWGRHFLWRRLLASPATLALNNIIIALRLDGAVVKWRHKWKNREFQPDKSLQENVEFSHRPDVEEALRRVHRKIRQLAESNLPPGAPVLDIGSGTGLVAAQLVDKWQVTGIDISPSLTSVARKHVPQAKFIVGDILEVELEGGFALAYSVGVLCYVPPGQLRRFLARAATLLADNGLLILQYPHAVARSDLWHPNLLYTKYSPKYLNRCAADFFETIAHTHSFDDGRTVKDFDRRPYPGNYFMNGYLYIGRRKSR